ncbi:MAG: thiol peroxidase [Desulfovibrio sp.]|nr:thiol peroxidase [Desulfovibrio sp.]
MHSVTFQGNPLHLLGTLPKLGEKAPAFTLTANDLALRTLNDYASRIVVLLCVPSLDTPVCDMEVRRFNNEATQLSKDVVLLAVSRDLPFAQARWCGASHTSRVETLSDYRDGSFGKSYGVYLQELDLLARAVFVLDKEGIVRYSELVPEVTNEPSYSDVLCAIQKLL